MGEIASCGESVGTGHAASERESITYEFAVSIARVCTVTMSDFHVVPEFIYFFVYVVWIQINPARAGRGADRAAIEHMRASSVVQSVTQVAVCTACVPGAFRGLWLPCLVPPGKGPLPPP